MDAAQTLADATGQLSLLDATERNEAATERIALLSPLARARAERETVEEKRKKAERAAAEELKQASKARRKAAEDALARARRNFKYPAAGFQGAGGDALAQARAALAKVKVAEAEEKEGRTQERREEQGRLEAAAVRRAAEAAALREQHRAAEARVQAARDATLAQRAAVRAEVEAATVALTAVPTDTALLQRASAASAALSQVEASEAEEARREAELAAALAARVAADAVWREQFHRDYAARMAREADETARRLARERAVAELLADERGVPVVAARRVLDMLSPGTQVAARGEAAAKTIQRVQRRAAAEANATEAHVAFALALAERFVAQRTAEAAAP